SSASRCTDSTGSMGARVASPTGSWADQPTVQRPEVKRLGERAVGTGSSLIGCASKLSAPDPSCKPAPSRRNRYRQRLTRGATNWQIQGYGSHSTPRSNTMKTTRALSLMASGSLVLALAACGGDTGDTGDTGGGADEGGSTEESDGAAGEDVTISWWHNSNTGEGLEYYEQVAADFEDANPGVTIQMEAMQHEDMLTQLDAAFQAGDAPDVYMERGGGELADHVEAGLTMDLTEAAAEEIELLGGTVQGWTVDDKVYALPFSVGVVRFWYNTEMFQEAGITEPPNTWEEMYSAIDQLKAAQMEPISVGAGDKWPAAHYWYQFALRHCSEEVLTDAVQSLD